MACDTCGHTMHSMGCRTTDLPFFWCPRCGTIKTCDAVVGVPALPERCRRFRDLAENGMGLSPASAALWHRLGIAEAINLPQDRPKDENR